MPQLIDLSKIKKEKQVTRDDYYTGSNRNSAAISENNTHLLVSILLKQKPEKMVYSLKEAAEILCIGQEFLRRRIKSGKINVVRLGDKPAINLVELARILSEGV